MSRLIETIRLQDGEFCNLHYHAQRMEYSLREIYGERRDIKLEPFLRQSYVPPAGIFRCRVVYDLTSCEVAYWPYTPKRVSSLRVVADDEVAYPFKYEDRTDINRLLEWRGDCDDVLIVREGYVTDCSFANIVFRKGTEWLTPDTPLLPGTMRQNLIDQHKIRPATIRVRDISTFQSFRLINALLLFEAPEIDVSRIVL